MRPKTRRRLISAAAALCFMPAAASCRPQDFPWENSFPPELLERITEGFEAPPVHATAIPVAPEPKTPESVFEPEPTRDIGDFSMTADEVASVRESLPLPDNPTARHMLELMRRTYVSQPPSPAPPSETPERLRIVTWNIDLPQNDLDVDSIIGVMKGKENSLSRLDPRIRQELLEISKTDVYMLQDISLPMAARLAAALNYHLAWAPEFIEVGANARGKDPTRGEHLTGNATLSRHPIEKVWFLRFVHQNGWYKEEKRKLPLIERAKNGAARKAFGAIIDEAEVRPPPPYGGRLALIARIRCPYRSAVAEGDSLLLINIHLENKAEPPLRRKQMGELFPLIRQSREPVVFGGDLNTTGSDGRIQSTRRFLKGQINTPGKVISKGLGVGARFVPYAGWAKTGFDLFRWVKSKEDPTSKWNREHRLFRDVERALGVKPANPRDKIGYKRTWSTWRPLQTAAGTLDWITLYAPQQGLSVSESRVYERLIQAGADSAADRISDHFPLRIDIPLQPSQDISRR